MKKGFTMIELIFVIVILGILASVAIPRLAATREDAEIATAIANLRTLLSDATAYHVVKGEFGDVKWNEITNVPLKAVDSNKGVTATDGILTVGNLDCINVRLADRNAAAGAAHIFILKNTKNKKTGVCKEVVDSEPLKPYFTSKLDGVAVQADRGVMAIGSTTSIHAPATTAQATTPKK
ncbi:MAG: type II secretion system protein [Campylobacter sp.]|nr:type II secretion system protein [Campylobacter sp.]